jgi:type I restriction-modification system DNA methylase subunit
MAPSTKAHGLTKRVARAEASLPPTEKFLEEVEHWRLRLAEAFAASNPSLGAEDLDLVTQRTLHRILFLRLCEDIGAEPHRSLYELARHGQLYHRLEDCFRQAERRYNSGLFRSTLDLRLEDEPLRRILHGLYPPESPHTFKDLPADILGQVYERFLGKFLHLTPDRQVRLEEKPSIRRAGGVYYTPSSIIDFLVHESVGALLATATLENVSTLRFLDPSCGSGAFLVRIYQSLLAWYEEQYRQHGRRLSSSEKQRILKTHIFGVDIDPHAVEVTRLSLLLQALTAQEEQVLTAPCANIKCGDSLVGTDWPAGVSPRPFDWRAEFPQVFSGSRPGFHAIIGNPPYDKLSGQEAPRRLAAFKARYTSATKKPEV